jgi:hypothetical protein
LVEELKEDEEAIDEKDSTIIMRVDDDSFDTAMGIEDIQM